MKVVASTDEYTVYLRRDGRHAVKGADKAPINGDEKVKILLAHELITAPPPKAPDPEPEAETEAAAEAEEAEATEEAAEDAGEADAQTDD
ncbi:MAG: hypothetical protein AAF993_18375 [Pseudomonadota bacterium]